MRNFRDLSYLGLKEGMLLRSDVLYKLTRAEKRLLKKEHNLKAVVDLRRPKESKRLRDSWMFGVKRINLPLIEGKRSFKVGDLELGDMPLYYRDMVIPSKKELWIKIFDTLLTNNKATLFHCSAGKDRTGVTIAIILYALGFDKKTIYQDYLLTNENPLFYKTIGEKMEEPNKTLFLENYKAREEYLDATFDEISKQYGTVDAFLKDMCNLDEGKIRLLREKFLPSKE